MSRSETPKRCPSEAPKSSQWCEEQRERIYQWKPWEKTKGRPKKIKPIAFEGLATALLGFKAKA